MNNRFNKDLEPIDIIGIIECISDDVIKEAKEYSYQSGFEIKFNVNPTQESIDQAIATAFLRGYLLAKNKL